MKKIIYAIVVLLVLLGLAALFKGYEPAANSNEEVVADDNAVATEEEVVVVDEEPVAEVAVVEETVSDSEDINEVVETVVEENPEQTAGEGETIVEE